MTKILVVDDEEGILELLDEDLSDDGFEVISGIMAFRLWLKSTGSGRTSYCWI